MQFYNALLILLNVFMFLNLAIISVIDLKTKTIHLRFIFVLLIGNMLTVLLNDEINMIGAIAAAASIFCILSLVYLLSRKSMGWGDVLLCTCMAVCLGIEKSFAMLIISVILCSLWALILALVPKADKYSEIPFAPFVTIGTVMTFLL